MISCWFCQEKVPKFGTSFRYNLGNLATTHQVVSDRYLTQIWQKHRFWVLKR